jgi:hypothetical protein
MIFSCLFVRTQVQVVMSGVGRGTQLDPFLWHVGSVCTVHLYVYCVYVCSMCTCVLCLCVWVGGGGSGGGG